MIGTSSRQGRRHDRRYERQQPDPRTVSGTPLAIVERLNAELARALAELIESTTNRMRKVVVEAKIRAD